MDSQPKEKYAESALCEASAAHGGEVKPITITLNVPQANLIIALLRSTCYITQDATVATQCRQVIRKLRLASAAPPEPPTDGK